MTALTLDALSGGRLLLGLGVSGPQVVEGWHGQPYGRPLRRTREYVEIVRRALARREPLTYEGSDYQIPFRGEGATGLGRPLRSILHPVRERIPVYLAAIGPRSVALAAEIADGWLPIFYAPEREEVFAGALADGLARAGRDAQALEVAAQVPVVVGEDVAACRDLVRPFFALYLGGMGAPGRNFYAGLAARYGYGEQAAAVQERFAAGDRGQATALVPDGLIDEVALVGPPGRIRERFAAWKASRVTTMIVSARQPEALELLAELAA